MSELSSIPVEITGNGNSSAGTQKTAWLAQVFGTTDEGIESGIRGGVKDAGGLWDIDLLVDGDIKFFACSSTTSGIRVIPSAHPVIVSKSLRLKVDYDCDSDIWGEGSSNEPNCARVADQSSNG